MSLEDTRNVMGDLVQRQQLELDLGPERARKLRKKKQQPEWSQMDHRKEFEKLIHENANTHHTWQVFRDFCEMAACAVSNAIERPSSPRWKEREEQYLRVVKRYTREEVHRFCRMLAHLIGALDVVPFTDVLGKVFGDLGLQSHWNGQFFTPDNVAMAMAKMTLFGLKEDIEKKGFIRMSEPCVGAGVMVIAAAQALMDEKINYQQALHVWATDVDSTACHMAYIQLSLLGIPAIVTHGSSLTVEEWSRWYTPMHVLGGWSWKLMERQRQEEIEHGSEEEARGAGLRPRDAQGTGKGGSINET